MIPGLPNQVSGQGNVAVPTMPDPSSEATKATAPGDQVVQALMQILQQSNRPRVQGQAPAVPGGQQQQSTTPPGYMTEGGPGKRAWGPERFMYTMGATLNNLAAQKQKRDVAYATNLYGNVLTALDKYVKPDGTIDGAAAANDPFLSSIPDKDKKKMSKMMAQSWLDPSKTPVESKAMSDALKARQKKDAGQAGLKKMVMELIHKATKPQLNLTPEQQQQSNQQVWSKAPTVAGGATNPKDASEMMNAYSNLIKAQADIKNKFDFKPDAQGNLLALDKTTGKAADITDVNGKPFTAPGKVGLTPKVAVVDGVPYGVAREGKLLTPDSPEWTAQDAQLLGAAHGAQAASDTAKDHRAQVAAKTREALYGMRIVPSLNKNTGELEQPTQSYVAAHPDLYAPAAQGTAALGATARFDEIRKTADIVNQSIDQLPDTGFDPKSRAQIALVLRDPDPQSALDGFLKSDYAATLNDAQINYVTALASMTESAMSLAGIQGQRGGSDKLRTSISAMLPSANTPSRAYAKRQMKIFGVELDQLQKGVAKIGALSNSDPSSGTPPAAQPGMKVQSRTVNGKTEYRQVPIGQQ